MQRDWTDGVPAQAGGVVGVMRGRFILLRALNMEIQFQPVAAAINLGTSYTCTR
jgi:hypothetical protein